MVYCIGDLMMNIIMLMMSYFGFIFVFVMCYDKKFGIGMFILMMILYLIVYFCGWVVFFYVWVFVFGLFVGLGMLMFYLL